MRKIIILIVLCVLIPSFGYQAFADSSLKKVNGTVEIQKVGTSQWVPASKGMAIQAGDRIKTGEKSKAKLELGKATVELGEKTEFGVQNLEANGDQTTTRSELILGRLKAKVAKLKGGSTFEIVTPTSVAAVRGTFFGLWVYLVHGDLFTRLDVKNGIVNFSDLKGGKDVDVHGGQYAVSGKDGIAGPKDSDDEEDLHEYDAFGDDLGGRGGLDQDSFGAQDDTHDTHHEDHEDSSNNRRYND